jgi:HAD superfamily hydrolase (TIGR01509 family)
MALTEPRLPHRGRVTTRTVPPLHAVLFDMDGTLVETEQYWGQALFALAERYGGQLSPAARAATVGTSMRSSMQVLYADVQLSWTEEQLVADTAWVEQTTAGLLAEAAPWRPGARELLSEVWSAGLRTALVTTTPRPLADLVLGHIIRSLGGIPFDVTVCGDEVSARKPDPAPYLQAMAALGVESTASVVVEDSLAGVTAGLAAGAAVLAVPSLQPLQPAAGLTVRDTLTGLGVRDLVDVLARRDPLDVPA